MGVSFGLTNMGGGVHIQWHGICTPTKIRYTC